MHFKLRALAFILLLSLPFSAHAVIIDKIAAIVNDDVITQSEIYALQNLKLNLSGLPTKDILDERIEHHLVLQQIAKQPPLLLPEEEVQLQITMYAQQHGGTDGLIEFLSSIGMNYSDFETEVREQISVRRFIADRFRPFVNISIEEAEKYYRDVYKPRLKAAGQEVPPFPETFNEIQTQLIESRMQDRIRDWLLELRRNATINIKE
jgi:peptidyl-prolyl cis-trans isomerase SurA